nr:HD domain-containing phosphohydrolase [Dissulfurirhabdus thermomarina]
METPPRGGAAAPGGNVQTVLLVDDEENILKALNRLLRREGYRVLATTSPMEAMDLVLEHPVAVVISDQRMPEVSGTELLAAIKEAAPDVVRVMLTGYADMEAAMDAINKGEVFRFITKPWQESDLVATVRQAALQHFLVTENRRLLQVTEEQNQRLQELNARLEEKVLERTRELEDRHRELQELHARLQTNFRDTVRVFVEIMELYDPFLGGHANRVAALARRLAERMGIEGVDLDLVEIGAALHDIGLIGAPKEVVKVPADRLTPAQQEIYRGHPALGQRLLKKIEFLRQAALLVRSHHERFDGQGFPDGLPGVAIPVGAMITHAASYLDGLVHREGVAPAKALERMSGLAGTVFDPEVVRVLAELVPAQAPPRKVVALPLEELEPGMRLAADIKTASGRFLVPRGTRLNEVQIMRLRNFHQVDPIAGRVRVSLED